MKHLPLKAGGAQTACSRALLSFSEVPQIVESPAVPPAGQ